jgi:hypothetical protein
MSNAMNFDAQKVIQQELEPGERLIWAGQPLQGMRFRRSDLFMIPFSVLWGGFAFFWEWTVIQEDGPLVAQLFGLPFVLVGLYMIAGRFFLEAKQREKTFYGISNERLIIASGIFKKTMTSLNLNTLNNISLTEESDGSGTITFGPPSLVGPWFGRMPWPGAAFFLSPSFDLLENAKTVYQHIRNAQKTSTSSPPPSSQHP